MSTVVFGSQAELEAALRSTLGQEVVADVANFATGGFSACLAHVEILTADDFARRWPRLGRKRVHRARSGSTVRIDRGFSMPVVGTSRAISTQRHTYGHSHLRSNHT